MKLCSVCNNELTLLFEFGRLIFTDTLLPSDFTSPSYLKNRVQQSFLYCILCSHGELSQEVDPSLLYGANYHSSSSLSALTREATNRFLSFSKKVAGDVAIFDCALDIGCNDLLMLDLVKDIAKIRVGVDPVWQKRNIPPLSLDLRLIG